jgi:hypothetical protein
LSHHTFFTTKLIPKLDKLIDEKNMGRWEKWSVTWPQQCSETGGPMWTTIPCVSQKWMKWNERFTHFSTVDVKWNVSFYIMFHWTSMEKKVPLNEVNVLEEEMIWSVLLYSCLLWIEKVRAQDKSVSSFSVISFFSSCCLLWIKKAKTKDKTYDWGSVN